jgi:hypothetical protein
MTTTTPAATPSIRRRRSGCAYLAPLMIVPALALAACGQHPDRPAPQPQAVQATASAAPTPLPQPFPSPEPHTAAAARKAAQVVMDNFAGEDYGAAWDGMDAASQRVVSREDYIKLNTVLCPPAAAGIPFKITSVRLETPAHAYVHVSRILLFSWDMNYQQGRWRLELAADDRAGYKAHTIDELASARRKIGGCRDE